MDTPQFDIYLTGRLGPGLTEAAAAERLAQLFRSTPQAMANLVTGKPQLLKRGVDEATATKFQEALQRAGLEVAIRPATATANAPQSASPVAAPVASSAVPPVAPSVATNPSGLSLAPVGADVLAATERKPVAVANIDTSHISLESVAGSSGRAVFGVVEEPLAKSAPKHNPFELDNDQAGNFTMAPAEGQLLTDAERQEPPPIVPDIPELTLAEPGALLETLHTEQPAVIADTSALTLAPEGGDLLTPEERPRPKPALGPDTSYLTLADLDNR